ncbi:MAG TPA: hypothetical protein ENJ27_01380 [Candidatus Moranbacteria bacterium]|nr:hypothetical protein [Candidatus Moranbacteria bacterium]
MQDVGNNLYSNAKWKAKEEIENKKNLTYMKQYIFDGELIQGLIKSRPNRFIMLIEINDKIEKCHYPSIGERGCVLFVNVYGWGLGV